MCRIELFVLSVGDFKHAHVEALADADGMGGTFVEVAVGAPGTNRDRGSDRLTGKAHREGAGLDPNESQADRVGDLLPLVRREDGDACQKRTGQESSSAYHEKRSASCRMRGSAAAVMRRKLALVMFPFASPKFAWLSVLNTSKRNCAFSRSRIGKSLCRPESQPIRVTPWKMLRPMLPLVPVLFAVTATPGTAPEASRTTPAMVPVTS